MAIKTTKEALATHIGWDMADLKDYEYHAGRYTGKVYTVGNDYFSCVKTGKKPPKPTRTYGEEPFNWIEVKDDYLNKQGFTIYKHTMNS